VTLAVGSERPLFRSFAVCWSLGSPTATRRSAART